MSNASEEWRPVPSRPGIEASSLGRVRCLPYPVHLPNGSVRMFEAKPTYGYRRKANRSARHVYRGIWWRRHGNMKIHRLVCEAFHGQPPSKTSIVLHLNENSEDNRIENLRWGTQRENLNMPGFIAYCKSRIGMNSPVTKSRLKRRHP